MRDRLLWVIVLTLGACQKYPAQQILPKTTQKGAHTLGFYLNKESWIPLDRGYYKDYELPKPQLSKEGGIKISATRIDEYNYCRNWFCIEVAENICEGGTFNLSNKVCKVPYQTYYYGSNKNRANLSYEIDTINPHYITFSCVDTVNGIVSGIFEFNAVSNLNDTLEFRSGRFDLKLEQ